MELVPKTPSVLISKIEGKKSMFSKFFWVPKVVFYQRHATVDLTSWKILFTQANDTYYKQPEFWPAWKLTNVTTPHWSNSLKKQKTFCQLM